MVRDDQQCPARGPGLTHTLEGHPGDPCTACGAPTVPAGGDLGRMAARQAGETPAIPPTVCSCWDCRHPNPGNVGERVLHRIRHEEFVDRMGDRTVLEGFDPPTPERMAEMFFFEECAEPFDGGQL